MEQISKTTYFTLTIRGVKVSQEIESEIITTNLVKINGTHGE